MDITCIKCKGAGMCGRAECPHIMKSQAMFKVNKAMNSTEFSTSSPAPFVGRFGYPYVNVGLLTPPERSDDAWMRDAPKYWAEKGFKVPEIVELRSSLINSRTRANIRSDNRFLELSQEVGMASKPVDVEIKLEDKPKFRLSTSSQLAPMGPQAALRDAVLASNPAIDRQVDKVVSDTDLKAAEGMAHLYDRGYDENFITRLSSVGNVGIGANRKMVPTRWAITMVDDTIAKHLIEEVKDSKEIDSPHTFFGSYLGNYYLVIMLPGIWSYELFEMYLPKASWNVGDKLEYTTDYESYSGRKNYAENCAGGYYSVRLAVLEKLKSAKRQAGCIAIRIITGDYSAPLGVWVTREAARIALKEKPLKFEDVHLAVSYAEALCKKKFGFDIQPVLAKSIVLRERKTQARLSSFL